jgi:hypothetical protein
MTGNEMFLLKRGCGALGLDEIAKEIKEKEDNAMAMEFTKCIGELLKKNGVVPKIKQYGCDFYGENSFQSRFGVIIDEFDFSEHDKVFENEIAGLKAKIAIKDMDYKTVSELLGKYQQENEALKKRIQELDTIDAMRIDEKRELKQRIDELESMETSELPFDPLECANYLINATYERETNSLERGLKGLPEKVNSDRYTVDELEQIAEHLLVYCKHNKELE